MLRAGCTLLSNRQCGEELDRSRLRGSEAPAEIVPKELGADGALSSSNTALQPRNTLIVPGNSWRNGEMEGEGEKGRIGENGLTDSLQPPRSSPLHAGQKGRHMWVDPKVDSVTLGQGSAQTWGLPA